MSKINRSFNPSGHLRKIPEQSESNPIIYQRKIPIRVESELNLSEHWTKKSKRHTNQKMAVHSYLRIDRPDIKPPCIIKLTRIAPRRFDSDNLVGGFKYIKDAIAEYIHPNLAIGRADDDPNIKWEYAQQKGEPKEYAMTLEVTLGKT